MPDGEGTMTYPDGTTFVGTMQMGARTKVRSGSDEMGRQAGESGRRQHAALDWEGIG